MRTDYTFLNRLVIGLYIKAHPEKTITIHIYPPDNPILRAFNKGDVIMKEKSYLHRNIDIIKNSSLLVACPVDKNKEELRSGTWSTIRQAKKLKLTILKLIF